MATQAFMVEKPASGASESVTLPEGNATALSFSTAEIQGMKLSENGELTISFTDGGTLTINNFRELAASEVQLSLEDGSVINSQELFETLVAELPPTRITQPGAEQAVAYNIEPGRKYEFDFGGQQPVEISEQDGALLITFADSGLLVLHNFQQAMDSDMVTEISFDGQFLSLREFADGLELAAAMQEKLEKQEEPQGEIRDTASMQDTRTAGEEDLAALAEELAGIEPAAGEAGSASAGGYGFNSSYETTPVNPLDDIGPIGPTALVYGLPEFQENLFFAEDFQQVDGPPLPLLEVLPAFVYEDGSVQLNLFADPNAGNSVFVKITVSGIPAGWGVDPNGGVYNAAAGTWSFTAAPGASFSGGPILFPPGDSDADISSLLVNALNTSTSSGLTSGRSATTSVTTDAVADTPDVSASDAVVDEDTPAPVNVATNVNDTDGSESITIVYIRGVPAGFTLSAGIDNGGGEWQLTKAELAGLTITPPANYFGTITLQVESVAEESNKSDTDFDFTNDEASAFTDLDITWKPVIDPPSVLANNGVDNAQVKEDGTVDVPLVASLNPVDSPNAFLTVTVTGFDPAWGTATAPVGTFNGAGTEWTITLPPGTNLSTVFTFTPDAQSDIDLSGLVATAIATEPVTGTTASAVDNFNVIVDAVADAPSITASGGTDVEGTAIAVNIAGALGADNFDGSESIEYYEVYGASGFTFNNGTDLGGGTWRFSSADLAGLTIQANDPNFDGMLGLVAKIFTKDTPTDGEYDTTDNTNSATTQFTVKWTPDIDPPSITVNNGIDDVKVKEDGSVDVRVQANLDPNAEPAEFLTVKITGIPSSWGFGYTTGTYDAGTSTWTVTLPAGDALDTMLTFTPPAQSDIDLTGLVATATATDPVEGLSASATDSFNIIVDAVADLPTIVADGGTGVEGTAIAVNIAGALGVDNFDGSESIDYYEVSGATGFTFNKGTDLGGGTWRFSSADLTGLTIQANDPNFDGSLDLTAKIFTKDTPNDGEYDGTDNTNSASDDLAVTWTPTINPPTILVNNGVDNALVKEDGTVNVSVVANLAAGAEPAEFLTVTITGFNPAWGAVTAPVGAFSLDGTSWTVTLPAGANLNTVFTFTPAAQSDIDLTGLVATATATDPVEELSASASDSFNVIVDAVADLPQITATGSVGAEGATLAVNIAGALGVDTDGSEIITGYQVSGVPAGFTFNKGAFSGVPGVWNFTQADLAGLTITGPANYDGTLNLTATVFNTENPVTDGEYDTTDNNNQNSANFTVTWTPEIDPPTITVNNGAENAQVKEDGTVDVNVVANLAAGAEPQEFLTVTITGFNPAWGTVTAPVGAFSLDGTTWSVTLPAGTNLNTAFTFAPVAQSDIDLTGLVATVVATDPIEGLSASASDSFNVIVDAVADAPSLDASSVAKEEGQPIDITLNGSLGVDLDGSEMITGYQISGVPAGFSFNQGTNAGSGVWTFTPAQIAGLQIISADPTFAGTLNLTATVFTTENPVSDAEYDFSDNNNNASDALTVTWEDDDEPIIFAQPPKMVDETNLGPIMVNGNVHANFFDDTPGSFAANGTFTSSTALTSNSVPVVVTQSGNTYTGMAGTEPIFTMTLDPVTGAFSFTLQGTLDHPDTVDHNDTINLGFGVRATDSDSDYIDGSIVVTVFDDGVTAHDDFNQFDENAVANGNVITGLNGGPGAADDLSNDSPNTVTEVAFGTTSVNVPGTGFVTINGQYGTLKIAADGSYTYTPFPAAGITTPAHIATLTDAGTGVAIEVYAIQTVTGVEFTVELVGGTADINGFFADINADGGPVFWVGSSANNMNGTAGFDYAISLGSIGGSDPNVTQATFTIAGLDIEDLDGANLGIRATSVGSSGADSLKLQGTATLPPDCHCGTDEFVYTLTDGDGDASKATLTLECLPDSEPIIFAQPPAMVDETNLGPVDASGNMHVNFFSDVPGSFVANGAFTSSIALTSGGVDVVVTKSGNTYTGKAGTETIFTMTIDGTTGEYDFSLLGTLDHPVDGPTAADHNDIIGLEFGVSAVDSDGDVAFGNIAVTVFDDGLTAHNDVNTFAVEATNKDLNIVLILDVSGSMGGDKLALLKSSVSNLLGDFGNYMGGDIKVHIVPFASSAQTGQTFTVTDMAGYNAAISFLNGLSANGSTNYESPLQSAISWLQGNSANDPIPGADTYTYFISDGEPNRYVSGSSNSATGTADEVMDQITGSDGSDEVALIQSLSTEVIGVGISVSSTTIARLNVIDSDGSALDVQDPNDLDAALQGTNPLVGIATGNVVTGVNGGPGAADDLSNDLDNEVTQIAFGSTVVNVPSTGTATINGQYGTLEIAADGSYTYTLFATAGGTPDTVRTLGLNSADLSGTASTITKNGYTLTSSTGGDLKWVTTSDGAGAGIVGDGTDKVYNSEKLFVGLPGASDAVEVTIADIGSNNLSSGIEFKVYLAGGGFVNYEFDIGTTTPVGGVISVTLDAATLGLPSGSQITGFDLYSSDAGALPKTSLLLADVETMTYGTPAPDLCDEFVYTITDGDGDISTATLKLKGVLPVLVVGENVDDVGGSTTDHRVGGNEGIITGGIASDVLVGDVGGSSLQNQTKDYNIVLMLDVSGSMGSPTNSSSRLYKLIDATGNLLNELGAYNNGDIKVHIVPFSTTAFAGGTFTVTDTAGLAAAINFLNTMPNDGWTNYEAGLQSAINWLEGDLSNDPIAGAETISYFISDGEPNRYLDDSGNVVNNDSASVSMNQINGVGDGTNEIATIQSLSDEVIGVGIEIGSTTLARLGQIDSDGTAINVNDADDLDAALQAANPLNKLADVGGDILNGGDGNDFIFGDTLNTDALAAAKGLGTNPGAGWDVFAQLEAGAGWDRQDTISYIRNHAEELAAESVNSQGETRQGGNDVLNGGAGNDTIFGQEGDDSITGGLGDDTIYGGSGADTFLFESIGDGIDAIMDFDATEGDALDLSLLLVGTSATQATIDDFVFATQSGGDTTIAVDLSGSGNVANATALAVLEGVTGLTVQELTDNTGLPVV